MRNSITILFLLILIIGGPACKSQKKQIKASNAIGDNSMTSLDWNGTYHGILPCADCEGIKTELVINDDLTYLLRTQNLDKDETVYETKGKFSWNENGSQIKLDNESKQVYQVGENRLFLLDQSGNKIKGDLADQNVLEKDKSELTGKHWKLITLNDKPVKSASKQPYMILAKEENRISGNTGCNNFFGTYETTENNEIKFSPLGMTKMACIGDNPEQEFIEIIGNTANYILSEKELILLDRDSISIAKFESDFFLQ